MTQHLTTDVVIVGAGFAGLSAADRLTAQGYGVVVLEGRSRVGGRSFGGEIAGMPIDLGAAWIGARHPELLQLAQRFGCATIPQYREGRNVLNLGGRRSTYGSDIPPVSPITLIDMGRVKFAFDRLTATVDLETPWKTPNAHALDAMTFGDWLRRKRARAKTRALMEIVCKVQWGCPLDEVSMLHVLTAVRALGGLDHMLAVEGGVEQDRFAVSLHQIAVRLAASLGDRVLTDAAVRRIEQDADGVTVHTDGPTVRARRALVATAASHRTRIQYTPALPEPHYRLARSWRLGVLSKAFASYDRPFWRADGLSGEGVSDTRTVFITFDVSPGSNGPGILKAFCDPRHFDGLPPAERRARVLADLELMFGPAVACPTDYQDFCWGNDDFAPGGPGPAVAPQGWTSVGHALRTPVGRIHWAGSDTATMWSGSVNGALLSARRAVDELLPTLQGESERPMAATAPQGEQGSDTLSA